MSPDAVGAEQWFTGPQFIGHQWPILARRIVETKRIGTLQNRLSAEPIMPEEHRTRIGGIGF